MRGALLVGLGVAGGLAGAGAQPTPAVEYAVVLWNVAKRSPQVVLRGYTQPVTAVMWAPDGRSVATGSREGVSLWNARTGERRAVLEGASSPLHWNPKQNLLATGSSVGKRNRLLVWDTATGRKTQEVLLPSEAAETSVAGLEWSPSGRKLAIGLGDGQPVLIWDAKIRGPLLTLPVSTPPFAWRPDESALATANRREGVLVWTLNPPKHGPNLAGDFGLVYTLAWSSNGKQLAWVQLPFSGEPCVFTWNPRQQVGAIGLTGGERGIAWRPKSEELAYSGKRGLFFTGGRKVPREPEPEGTGAPAWSPDGKQLAIIRADHTVGLWDPDQSRWSGALNVSGSPVTALAWHPAGGILATGGSREMKTVGD